jgi:hypothetical protein
MSVAHLDRDLASRVSALMDEVASLLHIAPRPIELVVHRDTSFLACTRQAWPPDLPRMFVSPDFVNADVLAHELAHCLVPSRSLFAAEGIATWVGCEIGANTRHLLFAEPTLDAVLRRYWTGAPSVQDLATRRLGDELLGPDRFDYFEGRLARAVAGSFCGYWLQRCPALASAFAKRDAAPPSSLLPALAGCPFEQMAQAWLHDVRRDHP